MLVSINLLIIIFITIFIHYLLKGLKDRSMKNAFKNPKLNVKNSWKDKYELDENGKLIPYERKWYYFEESFYRLKKYKRLTKICDYIIHLIPQPEYKERFAYSSTFLVWLIDFWHKLDMLQSLNLLCLSLYIYFSWWTVLVFFLAKLIGFYFGYKFKKYEKLV